MLSNKLTFSLVFVLALALIAGPALAQTKSVSPTLNQGSEGETSVGDNDGQLASREFVVFEKNGAALATNGIIDAVNQLSALCRAGG